LGTAFPAGFPAFARGWAPRRKAARAWARRPLEAQRGDRFPWIPRGFDGGAAHVVRLVAAGPVVFPVSSSELVSVGDAALHACRLLLGDEPDSGRLPDDALDPGLLLGDELDSGRLPDDTSDSGLLLGDEPDSGRLPTRRVRRQLPALLCPSNPLRGREESLFKICSRSSSNPAPRRKRIQSQVMDLFVTIQLVTSVVGRICK
ncbi:hypothetical protein EJB05_28349, partial [Eragrostis curvula]